MRMGNIAEVLTIAEGMFVAGIACTCRDSRTLNDSAGISRMLAGISGRGVGKGSWLMAVQWLCMALALQACGIAEVMLGLHSCLELLR